MISMVKFCYYLQAINGGALTRFRKLANGRQGSSHIRHTCVFVNGFETLLLALLSLRDGMLGRVAKVSWFKVFTDALSAWKLEAEPL